jgi:hypothetical protein
VEAVVPKLEYSLTKQLQHKVIHLQLAQVVQVHQTAVIQVDWVILLKAVDMVVEAQVAPHQEQTLLEVVVEDTGQVQICQVAQAHLQVAMVLLHQN